MPCRPHWVTPGTIKWPICCLLWALPFATLNWTRSLLFSWDSSVGHHPLFCIRMQRADREGCSGSSLHSSGHQARGTIFNPFSHWISKCSSLQHPAWSHHASSITTLTPREEAEVSLLTTSTRASYLIHFEMSLQMWKLAACGRSIYEIRHPQNFRGKSKQFRKVTAFKDIKMDTLAVIFCQRVFPSHYTKIQQYFLVMKY